MGEQIPKGTYQCGMCQNVFEFGRSVEEEMEEMRQNFGNVAEEDQVRICDRCYQLIRPDRNPVQYDSWKKKNAAKDN